MTHNTPPAMDPAALAIEDAAKLLSKVGRRPVTEAMLHKDIAAGAPTNSDGTISLVNYAAWLVQQMNGSLSEPS